MDTVVLMRLWIVVFVYNLMMKHQSEFVKMDLMEKGISIIDNVLKIF